MRGGRGKRFTSLGDFANWFDALPPALQRSVPQIDKQQREELGEEIGRLTFSCESGIGARLARDHDYSELVRMRDHWKDRDEEERGERAASEVLGKPVPW